MHIRNHNHMTTVIPEQYSYATSFIICFYRSFCLILDIFFTNFNNSFPKRSARIVPFAGMLSVFSTCSGNIEEVLLSKYTSLSDQSEISVMQSRTEPAHNFLESFPPPYFASQ